MRFLENDFIRIRLFFTPLEIRRRRCLTVAYGNLSLAGLTYCFIRLIKFYQQFVSLRLTPSCRYHPSCSSYFIQAIRHFGLLKGVRKGFLRILRCNPFFSGGYDPIIASDNLSDRAL